MDRISFNSALVAEMFAAGRFDSTNIEPAWTRLQAKVRGYLAARDLPTDLDALVDIDLIDDVLIMLTDNGAKSLFD